MDSRWQQQAAVLEEAMKVADPEEMGILLQLYIKLYRDQHPQPQPTPQLDDCPPPDLLHEALYEAMILPPTPEVPTLPSSPEVPTRPAPEVATLIDDDDVMCGEPLPPLHLIDASMQCFDESENGGSSCARMQGEFSECNLPECTVDIIFSTAHKAKGLEFNTVKLTDDFEPSPPLRIPGSSQVSEAKDEANLLYVAVTRAKKRLVLTPTLIRLLDMAGENFLYPQHTAASEAEIAANGCQAPCLTCALTAAQFKPCALTIGRPAISLSDGAKQEAGVVSPQVITAECPSLKVLYGALQGARQNTDGIANSQSSSRHWKAYVGRAGYGLGAGNVLRAAGQQVANQIEEIDDAELAELVGF